MHWFLAETLDTDVASEPMLQVSNSVGQWQAIHPKIAALKRN
jgi:hypothetical protein